jgi:hypothetical protein
MTMDMDEERQRDRPAVEMVLRLAQGSPHLSAMVEEHVADNGEILSTLLLSDVARWYLASYTERRDDPARFAEARSVVDRLGRVFESAGGDLANTIAVGFVETLIPDDWSVPGYTEDLPPALAAELVKMINWRPRRGR